MSHLTWFNFYEKPIGKAFQALFDDEIISQNINYMTITVFNY